MDEDKFYINYKINWKQEYPELMEFLENYSEVLIENSGFKEANELIEKIKNIKE